MASKHFDHSSDDESLFQNLLEMSRLATAMPVILSVICGVGRAIGYAKYLNHQIDVHMVDSTRNVVLLIAAAVLLNCASNVLNQITDAKADSINKPHRPIPSGRVSIYQASVSSFGLFIVSLALSWHITPSSIISSIDNKNILQQHQTFVIFTFAALITAAYSLPALGRLKSNAVSASLAIAIARGLLLSTAGSTAILDVTSYDNETGFIEAWVLGEIYVLDCYD